MGALWSEDPFSASRRFQSPRRRRRSLHLGALGLEPQSESKPVMRLLSLTEYKDCPVMDSPE